MLRNTDSSWGSVAKGLHWIMASLILAMFVLGWLAASWPLSPTKIKLFFWHKSIGVSLLALVLLRLAWRWINLQPKLPARTSERRRYLARISHASLYMLMLLMPLSGWVINSAANFPFKVYGWFLLPAIAPNSKSIQSWAELVHMSGFWIFIILLAFHIGAAIRHHVFDRDDVFRRMLPFR